MRLNLKRWWLSSLGNSTTALCIYPNDEYKTTRRVTEQERQEI